MLLINPVLPYRKQVVYPFRKTLVDVLREIISACSESHTEHVTHSGSKFQNFFNDKACDTHSNH
jgi:hypothetical protein